MAESSYPQPGLKPGDGPDCGAYTANQWRGYNVAKMRSSGMIQSSAPVLPTVAQHPDVGVFYAVPNRLAVTSPGANQISIATGASLVDGTLHYNDTAHTAVAITGPVANPRIDVVVVRQNYSAIDYTSANAPALVVTANTARIAIISGAEAGAPVAPGLTQDTTRATYWDIPLAQYEIAVGGVITNLTDLREWVDAEMKTFLKPFFTGRNGTDGTDIFRRTNAAGLSFPDNKVCTAGSTFIVQNDFISDMTVRVVVIPLATGNLYGRLDANYAACSETWNTHSDTAGPSAVAVNNLLNECILEVVLSNESIGDIVGVMFQRDAADPLDTLGATVNAQGILVEYLGWGRK